MSDPLKVRISRNLLKYEQSGLPHTKSFFAFTSLAITLTPEFTASQDHVVSLILNLKLFKGKDAQREPTIVALNPEKYKDGKEAPRPKRKVRPGLLDTDGDQSKVWERASHHLLGSEWGPEWRTRLDISITGAGEPFLIYWQCEV
ncbi:hypothetical protein BT69DRAFT_911806 [Atractiella rhizophila]|nr:hypothetical protein BT69DRAFT_911806 [Atractiella rhizophila]